MYSNCITNKYKITTMDIEDFDMEKVRSRERLSKVLSVRITRKDFEWIKKNRISATKLFNYALHKVMKQEDKEK